MRSPAATVRLNFWPSTKFVELRGEVLGATGGFASDIAGRARLEMAVVVVDPEDLKVDKLTFRIGIARGLGIAISSCGCALRKQQDGRRNNPDNYMFHGIYLYQ